MEHTLKNGEVWETPMYHRAVTQWLGADQWILLGTPEPSRWGGTCMNVYTLEAGPTFYTGAELEARLAKYNWQRRPTMQVQLSK